MDECKRLEELWEGKFGDDYSARWKVVADRSLFWKNIMKFKPKRILEVGCNVGNNLFHIKNYDFTAQLYGVDVNDVALKTAYPVATYLKAQARDLPFKDGYFDLVFTVGVLIHQPECTLPRVMAEVYRTSRKYILFAEYGGEGTIMIPYRNTEFTLFRRNYTKIWSEMYPEMRLVESGTASKEDGFDDLKWGLFEK